MKQYQSFMGWLLLFLHLLLFHFPSFSSSSSSSFLCHHDESSALLHFKSSFTVVTVNNNCEESALKTATWKNGTDCCSWHGVTCDTITGHVVGLNLGCENINGILHPNSTLFHLSHLQKLNLSHIDLSYSHFDFKFGRFLSLTHLDLSACYFKGEVPLQISHLSKLESLHLSLNPQLVWKETTLKRLVQNATNLRDLFLDNTDMSSIRPNSMELIFNQSSSLVTLNLQFTGLSGILKKSLLCNLPSIEELGMSDNINLEGQLPELSCGVSLRILDLSACQINGPIPLSFSNFTHLTSLIISFNNLNGSIPSSLLTLPRLTSLYLDDNDLSGQIPDVFSEMTKLQELSIADNLLTGTIPPSLLSLPSLVGLDLSNNRFTGHISAISSYSLRELHLNSNMLEGNIPESVFNLANLTKLILSSNNFSGLVDFKIFSNLQSLKYLSLSHNCRLSLNFASSVTVNYSFWKLSVLDLSSLSLKHFPKLLEKLPMLSSLDMSNNKLNGKVPNWLLETGNSLVVLNLSQNLFTSIDQISGNNYQLIVLDLSFNLLDSELSLSNCNMSSLELLNLAHNKLTGIIPRCLAKLSSLIFLDLQLNNFYGTLPSNFSKDNKIQTLNVNGNQLEGYIPKSLSHCKYLKYLNLGNNNIEDKFPDWLQTLQYLKVLDLRDNKLHGPISNLKIKHPFPNLVIFDISNNNFSGPLPKAYLNNFEAMKNVSIVEEVDFSYMEREVIYGNEYLGNVFGEEVIYYDSVTVTMKGTNMVMEKILQIFVTIDLSRNKFEGEIPDVIGEFNSLKGLNLSHNKLIGYIPQSMGKLTNLESLDLSSNILTGVIPVELINLNSLEVLNLSNNHLVGEIPQGNQFNTFTNDSYEGNSGLCGLPLSNKCGPEQHHSPPSAKHFWSEEKFGFGWKPVAIGYGCGFVIGIGIGCFVFLIGKPRWLVMIFGGQPKRRVNRRRTRVRRTNGSTQMVQMS